LFRQTWKVKECTKRDRLEAYPTLALFIGTHFFSRLPLGTREEPAEDVTMRLLMLGTGPFAVPTFRSVLESVHTVPALVTRPTPPAVGRQKAPPNPMRDLAEQRRLPILTPEKINEPAVLAELAAFQADLMIVCDYGQILSSAALAATALGGINLHASLLPCYRGAAPINWALWDGQTETGVSVIHMTPRLDGGPCLVQRATPIEPDEDAIALETRLARLGVEAVHEALALLAAWDRHGPLGTPQDPARVTRAPRLQKSDGQVDWTRSAERIRNQVRALKPWPGTFTVWRRPVGELRLILDQVSLGPPHDEAAADPGTVVLAGKQQLGIATGAGTLSIDRLQAAGKRVMGIEEFLRGHAVQLGDRFGP
jgi:methionyl-tRNA formyltransferase